MRESSTYRMTSALPVREKANHITASGGFVAGVELRRLARPIPTPAPPVQREDRSGVGHQKSELRSQKSEVTHRPSRRSAEQTAASFRDGIRAHPVLRTQL